MIWPDIASEELFVSTEGGLAKKTSNTIGVSPGSTGAEENSQDTVNSKF